MTFTREQKKEAYKKLPPEAQEFVMSDEITEIISEALEEAAVPEEYTDTADNEILCSLLGLQPLSIAVDKIGEMSGKNRYDLSDLEKKLNESIFSRIEAGDYRLSEKNNNDSESYLKETKPSGVGQSFEQIILNQARAMRPAVGEEGAEEPGISDDEMIIEEAKAMQSARPTDESDRIMNHESRIMDKKDQIPETQEKPVDVPNYGGNDPYREPLQ